MSKHDYHADGQKDATKGKYNPPFKRVGEPLVGLLFDRSKKDKEAIHKYNEGYKHTRKQRGH